MIARGMAVAALLALGACAGDWKSWPDPSQGANQGPVPMQTGSAGQGLAAEYDWVQDHRPLSQIETRRTEYRGNRIFHVVGIVRKNLAGDQFREEIWFDVTGTPGVS